MFDEIDKAAHRTFQRYITTEEIGIAFLLNSQRTLDDIQTKTLE